MDITTEYNRVCKTAGLIEVKAKIPTWKTPDGMEAMEYKQGKILTFWFKDGERVYDQPIGSARIESVLNAFKTQPLKTVCAEEHVISSENKIHNELVIGSVSALAGTYGISKELADLFFVKFDNQIYIKNPGLLFLAAKKGYGHMLMTDKFNDITKEWEAECKVFPVLTKETIESVAKLSPAIQERVLDLATQSTNGLGRAGNTNIKMKTMLVFARELAQTRAQNRALRAYTGYGGCSAEELE